MYEILKACDDAVGAHVGAKYMHQNSFIAVLTGRRMAESIHKYKLAIRKR